MAQKPENFTQLFEDCALPRLRKYGVCPITDIEKYFGYERRVICQWSEEDLLGTTRDYLHELKYRLIAQELRKVDGPMLSEVRKKYRVKTEEACRKSFMKYYGVTPGLYQNLFKQLVGDDGYVVSHGVRYHLNRISGRIFVVS